MLIKSMDLRKIPIQSLTKEELEFDAQLQSQILDLGEDIQFGDGVDVFGDISVLDGEVLTHATIQGQRTLNCSRCLDKTTKPYSKDLSFSFELPKSERYIDLSPHLREELIIDAPTYPLCDDHCKGLCESCGVNKNHEKCSCSNNQSKK